MILKRFSGQKKFFGFFGGREICLWKNTFFPKFTKIKKHKKKIENFKVGKKISLYTTTLTKLDPPKS